MREWQNISLKVKLAGVILTAISLIPRPTLADQSAPIYSPSPSNPNQTVIVPPPPIIPPREHFFVVPNGPESAYGSAAHNFGNGYVGGFSGSVGPDNYQGKAFIQMPMPGG